MGKIVKPITPEELVAVEVWMKNIYSDFDTICNRIRKVYNSVNKIEIEENVKKSISNELKNIMIYAKRMDNKLDYYYHNNEYEI